MIIAIDPSINHIGCAAVEADGSYLDSTTIKTQGQNASQKLASIAPKLKDWLNKHECANILIEHTRFFARANNQSHASAQKLNLAKGAIYATCAQKAPDNTHLVWIPGFNKQQAELLCRIYKAPTRISQHEKDAFWLANTWSQCSAIQRKKILTESEF